MNAQRSIPAGIFLYVWEIERQTAGTAAEKQEHGQQLHGYTDRTRHGRCTGKGMKKRTAQAARHADSYGRPKKGTVQEKTAFEGAVQPTRPLDFKNFFFAFSKQLTQQGGIEKIEQK